MAPGEVNAIERKTSYLHFPREGGTRNHKGNTRFWSRSRSEGKASARAFIGVSIRKAGQGR